ncbi:hypothetical protein Sesv_2238 [Salmonella enterica subsp. enterica serovar Virchow str. SVQ1]|nr:hypothetical protein Sesv_2238 [Salmonella enterica subsp. enterica serovar Virchow str. SVQ1]
MPDGGINAYPAYSFPFLYAISLLSYFSGAVGH